LAEARWLLSYRVIADQFPKAPQQHDFSGGFLAYVVPFRRHYLRQTEQMGSKKTVARLLLGLCPPGLEFEDIVIGCH
jgi:hypothetical protein